MEWLFMEVMLSQNLAQGRLTYQTLKTDELGVKVFGIKIISRLFDSLEEEIVTNVTVDEGEINKLFDLCVRNVVLPSTLRDIVEDFIIRDDVA
jgi:hypothetical protein